MPLGTRHVETGMLCSEDGQFVLIRDLGGRWRLDWSRTLVPFANQRVRIERRRTGFDFLMVLDVTPEPLR